MYYQILISAPNEAEAIKICDALLTKKLIAGGRLTPGNTRYWWDGQIEEKVYWNLNAFTLADHKESIIGIVKTLSSDETPIIAFTIVEGSNDFLNWIAENAAGP